MFLDPSGPKDIYFRRYSTNIVILDVNPQKSYIRGYSAKTVILDVMLPEYAYFSRYSREIQCF